MRVSVLLPVAVFVLVASAGAQTVYYVDDDATGANDGSSWTDAFDDLQLALAAVVAGDEIRVAQGIYTPGTNRTDTFLLDENFLLYGGYAGVGAPDPDARDWAANVTVLSGDIDGNDNPSYSPDDPLRNNTGNSYHVVTVPMPMALLQPVIDGFTITGGRADGAGAGERLGGGFYCGELGPFDWSAPLIVNCAFVENYADSGGGLYFNYAAPVLLDCTITGNVASWRGGGAHIQDTVDPVFVTGCVFDGNSTLFAGQGGALSLYSTYSDSVSLVGCTFNGNVADELGIMGRGGALYAEIATVLASDCLFSGNAASEGGAVDGYNIGVFEATRCRFVGNIASGGYGGAISRTLGRIVCRSCVFSGNFAESVGGGVRAQQTSEATLTNCTFVDNTASSWWGGAAAFDNMASPGTITNCLFWGNTALAEPDVYGSGGALPTVSGSRITQAGGYTDGGGNILGDPLFVDADGPDDAPGTPDDDLRLLPGSACIDAADGAAAPGYDVDGFAPYDDLGMDNVGTGSPVYVDIGAHERQSDTATTLTVLSPVGGENWMIDYQEAATWSVSGGRIDALRVQFSHDGGSTWQYVDGGAAVPNTGSYQFMPRGPASTTCRVRISVAANDSSADVSPADFTLVERRLAVSLGVATAAENSGTLSLAGTVSVPKPASGDVVVFLSSSDTTELTVPPQVTISGGSSSADFDLVIENDGLVDGPRTATVTATAASYSPAGETIVVTDDDPIAVTLPAQATEGDAPVEATIQLDEPAEETTAFALVSSDTTALLVSATAAIPAGGSACTFYVIPVDDSVVDGTQTATVTVSAAGWAQGAATISVLDNDSSAGDGSGGGGCAPGGGFAGMASWLLVPFLAVGRRRRRRPLA